MRTNGTTEFELAVNRDKKTTAGGACPACNAKLQYATSMIRIFECPKCGAIHGHCYKGESYDLVLPYWHQGESADERYFDFETLGSGGIERRHGWFDAETRRITQTG